MNRKMGSCT